MGTLYLRYDHWSETTLPEWNRLESQHKAIRAEIKNKSDSRPIGSVSYVRAELIIGDDEFSPLSWIDNEFNLVKFDFGASQFVVLTVEVPGDMHGDWRIPISRKDYDYPSGLRALYLDNFVKVTIKNAPVRLNLLHVSAGKVLKSFRGVATRFFGTCSCHSRKTSLTSIMVTSRYIPRLPPGTRPRTADVYRTVR